MLYKEYFCPHFLIFLMFFLGNKHSNAYITHNAYA